MKHRPPRATRTDTPFPDTTLFRSHRDDTGGTQAQQTLDPAALYQAQMAMRAGLPQATTPTPLNPNAFADMVERHLKQMATDRAAAADAGDGRVLLRMADPTLPGTDLLRSYEHTSEPQSLMRISYAVFCLRKKQTPNVH